MSREATAIPRDADAVAVTLAIVQDALSDRELEAISDRLSEIAEPWRKASEAITKAKQSDLLNAKGQRAAIMDALRQAQVDLEPQRKHVKELEEYAAGVRRKATEVPVTDRDAAGVADENFIREQLTKLDPALVAMRYVQACADPRKGAALINAVRRSVELGFPLVSEDDLRRGEDALLETSPLRSEVERAEESTTFHRSILGTVTAALGHVSEREGVTSEVAEPITVVEPNCS